MDFLNAINPQWVLLTGVAGVVIYLVVSFIKSGSEDLGIVKSTNPQTEYIHAGEFRETPEFEESLLQRMTKGKLEDHARELGIELDRRMTKANMLADFKSQMETRADA
jgi:hypothetical protein